MVCGVCSKDTGHLAELTGIWVSRRQTDTSTGCSEEVLGAANELVGALLPL